MMSSVIGGAMLPHAPQFFTMPETEDRNTVERVKAAAEIGTRLRALRPDLWIIRSFSRLCGGPYRPLSFDKLVRPYQPPALYTNLKGAKGAIAAQYPPPTFLAS